MEVAFTELMHLGLSEKEARVYVASLELGRAPVQDIAARARVNRATTYLMIEALQARGLMSTSVQGKKRLFVAENPERFSTILRLQQTELTEKQAHFGRVLPQLLALFHHADEKPQVRYFEGEEGLKTAREIFERLEGEYLEIVSVDDAQSVQEVMLEHSRHAQSLLQQQVPHKILAVLHEKTSADIPLVGVGEVRCVPAAEFPLRGELTVRGNHVFLFSFRGSALSVLIVSEDMAQTIRALFLLAWKGAESFERLER